MYTHWNAARARYELISDYSELSAVKALNNQGIKLADWEPNGRVWVFRSAWHAARVPDLFQGSDERRAELEVLKSEPFPTRLWHDSTAGVYRLSILQEQCDAARRARFFWDAPRGTWATKDRSRAAQLAEFAEEPLRSELLNIHAEKAAIQDLSRSAAPKGSVQIPIPEGLKLLPYQSAGVEYLAERAAALIADEMGLGKTIQAISLINLHKPSKTLVICPASLKINWKRELEKWLTEPRTVGIANGKELPSTDIVILNYDILQKHRKSLEKVSWDILIADESHYLKNYDAKRTQALCGKFNQKKACWDIEPLRATRRYFLTGTPILNRPKELWTALAFLDPEHWLKSGYTSGFWRFVKRYCAAVKGRWGWDLSGASNLSELQEILRERIMLRRMKADVLKELPLKQRQVIDIPDNGCAAIVKKDRDAWAERARITAELRARVEIAKASADKTEYVKAIQALQEFAGVTFEEMSEIRHETALAKIPYTLQHCLDVLESQEKLVVFAHHREVIERLREGFQEAGIETVIHYGGLSDLQKQAAVDSFESGSARVFVGSILSSGVGITLVSASVCVFHELDWRPAMIQQAEDRLHRIGQHKSVLIQFLMFDGSFDSFLAKTIIRKLEVIEAALDADTRAELLGPDGLPDLSIDFVIPEKSLKSDIATSAEAEAIHNALRILDGVCDGAVERDGVGFNAPDAHAGHKLAGLPYLTKLQATIAQSMLVKYRKQLGSEMMEACGIKTT